MLLLNRYDVGFREVFILLTILFLLAAIPFGVYLVKEQQNLKSYASSPKTSRIEIFGPTVSEYRTTQRQVKLKIIFVPDTKSASASAKVFPEEFKVANQLQDLDYVKERSFSQNNLEMDWVLLPGRGLKTVYAQFKAANNWLPPISTTIYLESDEEEPSMSNITPSFAPRIPTVIPSLPPQSNTSVRDFDLNNDKVLDEKDVEILITKWRSGKMAKNEKADFNSDGVVNNLDYALLRQQIK